MRAPSPKRRHLLRQSRRRQLGVLALIVAALACSGVAVAGDLPTLSQPPKAKPASKPRLTNNQLTAKSILKLLERVKAAGREASASAKKKRKRAATSELIFSMSVDAGFSYRSALRFPAKLDDPSDFGRISSVIIRRNLASGVETKLYESRSTIAFGVVARNGHAVAQIIRIAAHSKRSFDFSSSILAARTDEISMRILQSAEAEIREGDDEIVCGAIQLIAGMSTAGEVVVRNFNSDCKAREFSIDVSGIAPDGTTRTLLAPSPSEPGLILLGGDTITMNDPFDQTLITRNVTTGETKPLWSGSATALDFAADGSVAIASEAEPEFIPPPGGLPSPEIKPDKPEPAKIIVFRGGDPDSPKLSQLPRRNADIIRYCANRLYVVRATGRAVRREPFDPEEDELFAGVTIGSDARYEVLLLTADGAVERSLAKTKSISIGDVACNGERLLVGTNNLLKIGVLEFGP